MISEHKLIFQFRKLAMPSQYNEIQRENRFTYGS